MKRNKTSKIFAFILFIVLIAAYFMPLPYYVSKPGKAMELEPVIKVEDGYDAEGSFMLTTVRMGKANLITYAAAKMMDHWNIYPEADIRGEEETDEEYEMRQLYMMEGSKEKAIINAFRASGKPYEITYKGIYVYNVMDGMPASAVLEAGDRVIAVDGNRIESSDQFTGYISGRQKGSSVELQFVRDGKELTETIEIQVLPETGKPGIGITLTDDIEVDSDPTVEIDSESIGGPSAGLMFSLEVYNQLEPEDLTGGRAIAGTGTIDEKGNVGPIGGIDQKVVAAHKSGADVFFAPNEDGESNSNYAVAKKTAEEIGTEMDIVPVDTFEDAIEYLENLSA